jgi:nucleoside-diphosphate-sugar epimerase
VTVLVTGANGFAGQALCAHLRLQGVQVRRAVRRMTQGDGRYGDDAVIGEIGPDTQWHAALDGIETVVHLAARAHVMHAAVGDSIEDYRRVNVQGTRRLALEAASAGVRRFVFLSSVKVNGETTEHPFTEEDAPHPTDAYGISKWEAEQVFKNIAQERGIEWVILRPPLVYGPGVRANFLRLMRAVDRGIPLPLGALQNRRSLLYLGNLIDAILVSLSHPGAANQVFLLSDGEDISTPDLVHRLAAALRVRPRLLSTPPQLLWFAGWVTGRMASTERLTRSLQVDSSRIRKALGWTPPFSLDQGLAKTVDWYRTVVSAQR